MAETPAFLTAEQFSKGTNGQISADDDRVLPLLEGASAAVRRYCGWHISPTLDATLTLDGDGGRLLTLPTLKLVGVESITVNGEVLAGDAYDWSESGMVELRNGCWPRRFRSITVQMKHGLEDAPDVVQVVQQVVANAISSALGATREQAGQVSISWSLTAPNVAGGISLLQRDLDTLNLYKLPGRI